MPKRSHSAEVIARKRQKEKEKRQAAKAAYGDRKLTPKEVEMASTMLRSQPRKASAGGTEVMDYAGAAEALRSAPYNWSIPYETMVAAQPP